MLAVRRSVQDFSLGVIVKLSLTFSWSACYVGFFWSRYYRNLYIQPIPFLGIKIYFVPKPDLSDLSVIDPLDEFGFPHW